MAGQSLRERLAFNFGSGTVPGHRTIGRVEDERDITVAAPPAARRADRGADWSYLGLLVFTAVLLTRPQDQIPGLGALHLAELSALVAVASMVMQRLRRGLPLVRMTPEVVGLLAFGGAILVSVPFSIWPGGALALFTDSYLKVLIVFVLMANTLTTPRRLEQITWLIVLCCGYVAGQSIVNYLRGINLVEGNRLGGAVGGIFGNPNDLAMNMVAFLPAAIIVAFATRYATPRRLVAAAALVLMFGAIVFSKSRGGGLGLAAMLLTLMLLGRRVRPGFSGLALVVMVAATPLLPSSFWARMASTLDAQRDREQFSGSREARSTVMLEGLQAFASRPLTGVGAGQFPNYNPPDRRERWRETHNALLQVAAETGLFGLLAFCFLIVRGGLAAAATRKMLDPPHRRGSPDVAAAAMTDPERRTIQALNAALTAGLAGWFVCALFGSIAYNWTFYYLLALLVAARELTRDHLAASRSATARGTMAPAPHVALLTHLAGADVTPISRHQPRAGARGRL